MKKTIKRGRAVAMYDALNGFSFRNLEDADLEKVMDNLVDLERFSAQFKKLMEELGKRLYGDHDQEKIKEFNSLISAAQKIKDIEKRVAAMASVKKEHPELYELLSKQIKVEASLKDKDIEVELAELDEKAFKKAIIKANADVPYGMFEIFEPMYKEEAKEEAAEDFSELDELLNE